MSKTHEDSEFLHHEPCPNEKCGSSDGLARYSDGHGYCFSCNHREAGTTGETYSTPVKDDKSKPFIYGDVKALAKRLITQQTAQHFNYQVGEKGDKAVQIANYYKGNELIGQKLRFPDKTFAVIGKLDVLYGEHLWRDGGKLLVVTEGEIDAMSVSQLQGNKWPVVSVPNGAQGAAKAIAKRLEWVEKFETVVFVFDMDDVGQAAAQACAAVLSPSKAKIARLPLKDANEMLVAGRGKEVIDAIWSAKGWRPDGIVTLEDIYDKVMTPVQQGLPWWCERLTKLTHGRREGEIYTFGAGTGVGKTDFLTQQIEYDINVLKKPVALFFLEQNPVETIKRIAGKYAGKRFHVPNETTQEELIAAVDAIKEGGKLHLFDHFGAMGWEDIKQHIRYLAHGEGVKLFYLDHLTALAASEDDERTALERIMSEMGSLVQELGIVLHLVSHLATPDGTPHEEGGRVMIRHFKGSRSIGFWSFFMFGLERNQQAEDPIAKQTTTFRVLKDRLTGQSTGETIAFGYEAQAGKLYELTEEDLFPPLPDNQQISEF